MRISYEEINHARKELELGETATLGEIKGQYRLFAKKWHPDKCSEEDKSLCHAKMKEINIAYKLILKYIENYRYSFKKEQAGGEEISKYWERHFGKGPGWD